MKNVLSIGINDSYRLDLGFKPNAPLFKFKQYPTQNKDIAKFLRDAADLIDENKYRTAISPVVGKR